MVLEKKKVFNEMHSLGKTESHQQLKKKKIPPSLLPATVETNC